MGVVWCAWVVWIVFDNLSSSSHLRESANPAQNKYFTKFSKASQMLWGDSQGVWQGQRHGRKMLGTNDGMGVYLKGAFTG